MVVLWTGAACTGTAASASVGSLEHPPSNVMTSNMHAPHKIANELSTMRRERNPRPAPRIGQIILMSQCIVLLVPRQCLQIRHRYPESHLAVVICLARLRQRVLRV